MSEDTVRKLRMTVRILIGSVWVFHGLYSKILNLIPRHQMIVGRVLGEDAAAFVTPAIGVAEILLGLWVYSAIKARLCALTQTVALVSMNTLEILLARDLLLHPPGMVALNLILLSGAWFLAWRNGARTRV
jgi:uncharacterized membrane protein YphA (DoxX/SURF4 family)